MSEQSKSNESGSENASISEEDSNNSESQDKFDEKFGKDDEMDNSSQGGNEKQDQITNKFLNDSIYSEGYEQLNRMEQYQLLEEQMVKYCKENQTLWVDKDFPASKKSLFSQPTKIPEWAKEIKSFKWLRPHDITKDAKFMIDQEWDVKQGAFGESWLIGALVIASTRDQFIEKLFVDYDHFEMGFVTFQFFKNGEWVQVTVDTLLPYDTDSKQICIGQSTNPSEFWVPLLEKAYAKLHGCYQTIVDNKFVEGLVDITGGISEKWVLTDPGCINKVEGKGTKNADTGVHGILENHFYGIQDIREFPKEGLKLIKIRNPWGPDGGWNGPFSDDSEEWDKYRNLRDQLKLVFKSKKSDGNWWMSFKDWCQYFNNFYVCKVFPENWNQFSIESCWSGKTQGFSCPQKNNYQNMQPQQLWLQLDSDDKWFNNPQFRIKVTKETKVFISLMQEDQKLCGQEYIDTSFMVIANKQRNFRIWERPDKQDIIREGVKIEGFNLYNISIDGCHGCNNEITTTVNLKRFEGKPYGYYMIIPNIVSDKKTNEKRRFWLRLFTSEQVYQININNNQVEVIEMPETLEFSMDGSWNVTPTQDSAGGKRCIEGLDNPNWCKNPQYFLNIDKPTHLKIILRKVGNVKKNKGTKVGLTIHRFNQQIEKKEDITYLHKNDGSVHYDKNQDVGLSKLIQITTTQLEPPQMGELHRLLQCDQTRGQSFKESQYSFDDYTALYFYWNPTEGPFVIVPSLDLISKQANYKLTIYSDNPVDLQKLDDEKNQVIIHRWEKDISDGGCHLHFAPIEKQINKQTWTSNPKFLIQFKNIENLLGPVSLRIDLCIAEKNWKSKSKNPVGGMICVYLLKKTDKKISLDDMIKEPNFLPLTKIHEEFVLEELNQDGYYIMPTTYDSKIFGNFILSVSSSEDFSINKS